MVGDLPANVMRQQFASVKVPIASLAFTGDEMMSQRKVESIHSFYGKAPVTLLRINPADTGKRTIGHLGWFRERYRESLWRG